MLVVVLLPSNLFKSPKMAPNTHSGIGWEDRDNELGKKNTGLETVIGKIQADVAWITSMLEELKGYRTQP